MRNNPNVEWTSGNESRDASHPDIARQKAILHKKTNTSSATPVISLPLPPLAQTTTLHTCPVGLPRRLAPCPRRAADALLIPSVLLVPKTLLALLAYWPPFLLTNVLVWGAALPISKFAVEVTTPFLFLFYRFVIAGVLSLPILVWYWRKRHPKWSSLLEMTILEIIGVSVALGVLYTGLQYTTSLESSLLTSTLPLFITFGALLFLKEVEEKYEWIGLGLALLGTLLLAIEPLLTGRHLEPHFSPLGNGLVLLHNLAASSYFLLAKRRYQHTPKLFISSFSFWVGVVTFGLIALAQFGGDGWALWQQVRFDLSQPTVLWPAVYMGVFGSIIGLTAYIAGQNLIEASEASMFSYLQPLVYIPLAWVLHGEEMSSMMLVAVIVIGAGVITAETRWCPRVFRRRH